MEQQKGFSLEQQKRLSMLMRGVLRYFCYILVICLLIHILILTPLDKVRQGISVSFIVALVASHFIERLFGE